MFLNLISYPYKLYKLRKNQWQSPYELKKLQVKKLKALIQHAYYKVDYYRKLFDRGGIKPENIKDVQDIVKIPLTARKELQTLPKKESIAKDANLSHCLKLWTSGSTGIPLEIFLSFREIIIKSLFYRRMYTENGGKLNDRTIIITHPQHFISKKWFEHLGLLQETYISIFDDIENQIKVILEFNPQIIYSYASALKNLATEIKNKEIKDIKPRIIFSTADQMTKEDREFIGSVFQADVIDYYATNECGVIAWECKEHLGYHINSDNVIVEFLKGDGTKAKGGEEGEIVITSLNSYTMPFIRYKIGDTGVLSEEECPCGRTLPLIRSITGRSNDYFILPNGKKVYSFSLRLPLKDIPGISQYQIIQEKKDKVRINLVKNGSFSSKAIFQIKENYKRILGDNIEVKISFVEEIIGSRSGKFQDIKSELQ